MPGVLVSPFVKARERGFVQDGGHLDLKEQSCWLLVTGLNLYIFPFADMIKRIIFVRCKG